jgi:hypothetical protein
VLATLRCTSVQSKLAPDGPCPWQQVWDGAGLAGLALTQGARCHRHQQRHHRQAVQGTAPHAGTRRSVRGMSLAVVMGTRTQGQAALLSVMGRSLRLALIYSPQQRSTACMRRAKPPPHPRRRTASGRRSAAQTRRSAWTHSGLTCVSGVSRRNSHVRARSHAFLLNPSCVEAVCCCSGSNKASMLLCAGEPPALVHDRDPTTRAHAWLAGCPRPYDACTHLPKHYTTNKSAMQVYAHAVEAGRCRLLATQPRWQQPVADTS